MSNITLNKTHTQPISLPEGFTFRPLTLADIPATVKLVEACERDAYPDHPGTVNAEDYEQDWTEPGFDLEKSVRGVFAPDGQMVALVEVFDKQRPVHPWTPACVHPEFENLGIATYIMTWAEQRAREVFEKCPPDARISMRTNIKAGYEKAETFLTNFGMTELRYSWAMRIDLKEQPPHAVLPAGFSIRSYQHPDELETLVVAQNEMFQDHFGHVEQPIEERIKSFKHWTETDSKFNPSNWLLAIDDATGRIAGMSLCRDPYWGDDDLAYVSILGVGRDYRKQGLGLALLQYTWRHFWDLNRPNIMLHVDASSLTGATRLYERAGMYIYRRSVSFDKTLREGIEIEKH